MAGLGGSAGTHGRLPNTTVTRCRQHRPRLRQSRSRDPVLNPST
jgi:hypothetical protein